jgi:hypothetical protein
MNKQLHARGIFEFGDWMLDFSQEWSEWFSGDWNWRSFTFLKIYYEDEICMGQREWQVRLLGVGVRIVYIYDRRAEKRLEIEQRNGASR